jgi:hypothetical protein
MPALTLPDTFDASLWNAESGAMGELIYAIRRVVLDATSSAA